MDTKLEQELHNIISALIYDIKCLKKDVRDLSKIIEKKNEYITELEEKLGLTE